MVDQCGKEVRYIIDYYDVGDVDPNTHHFAVLDVRLAIDSWLAIYDRMKVAIYRWRCAGIEDKLQIGSSINLEQ